MLDALFKDQRLITQLRSGLLGRYLDELALQLIEQGYAKDIAAGKIGLVADFVRWLEGQRFGITDIVEKNIEAFFESRLKRVKIRGGSRLLFRQLLDRLRADGQIPSAKKSKQTMIERCLNEYGEYLIQERGLSRVTIGGYELNVRRFLENRFNNKPVRLHALRQQDTNEYMQHRGTIHAPITLHGVAAALRSFYRFLYLQGYINRDLASGVPVVAAWRLSNVPRFLKLDEVQLILDHCDQNTTKGQRDYAILLLLARLGLRAGEIVAMKLDDIDWHVGEILIRGKGLLHDRLPIPKDVGKALTNYLRHGRPSSKTRQVFVRINAPHRGFARSAGISTIVQQAVDRTGLHPAFKGAHLLRHSLATGMLKNGASLAEIGEVLRHRCLNNTEIYSKVNFDALRTLTQPWPGDKA